MMTRGREGASELLSWGFAVPALASEAMPATPPRVMLSTALLGTMIVLPHL